MALLVVVILGCFEGQGLAVWSDCQVVEGDGGRRGREISVAGRIVLSLH